jgi:putative serine protease PepD
MDDRSPLEPAYQDEAPAPRRGRRSGGAVFLAAVVGGIVGAAIVGGAVYFALRSPGTSGSPAANSPAASTSVTTSGTAEQPLEAAAARVLPSVVNVAIDTPVGSGVGSGVIIRSNGYILTNNHVVEGATKVTVRLGTSDYAARVVGTDPTSDLAVIKVTKTGLPVAMLGSAARLQVGETVLAIGSPFGLDKTVTSGIVSALHRSNLSQGASGVTAYTDLIQTDAAINPGNSGGALADLSGEVVGINALIESPSGQLGAGQSAGIGFAIPIDFAKSVADQIIAGKTVTHPFLGISSVTVTPAFAQQFGLSVQSGALVQQVSPGSPAAAAGIRVGDIIVRVGTEQVTSSADVFTAVRASAIGTPIAIELVRNGANVTVHATLVAK